jgi:hypothetical protein
MAGAPVKIIWGGAGMRHYPLERGKLFLEILEKYDVKEIDTAFTYVRPRSPSPCVLPV